MKGGDPVGQKIPKELFDEVIAKNDIVDVVSQYVQLTKAGRNYKGLCPFHSENTPSFVVSPDKGIYKCFGCGEGGNAVTFVSQLEGLSYPEAVLRLANAANIQTDFINPIKATKRSSASSKEFEMMSFVQGFYHYYLKHTKEGKEALAYLKERQLSEEMIEKFNIGLAPTHGDALVKTLEHNQYPLAAAKHLGLLNEYEGKFFDRFKSRIMFPIHDKTGQVVGFSGRVFGDEDQSMGKYVNSPESQLFQKSKLVYHLNEAKYAIRRQNRVLLFEGFLDVISAVEAGFLESVATMGTALTEEHALELRRLTDNVTICYDGDKAGQAAAIKAIRLLAKHNFSVTVLLLPDKLDPDEYIKQYGNEAFASLLERAIPGFDFEYYQIKKQFNLSFLTHKEQFKSQIFQLVDHANTNTLKELLLKQLAVDSSISYEGLLNEYQRNKSQVYKNSNINKNKNANEQIQSNHLRDTKYDRSEKMLIHYMLKDRAVALKVEKELKGYFFDAIRRNIVLYILDYYTMHETMDLQFFLHWIDEELVKPMTDIIFQYESLPPLQSYDVIDDLIDVVKQYMYKIQLESLKREIAQTLDETQKLKLLGKVNALKQQFGK